MKVAAAALGLGFAYCNFRSVHEEARKSLVTLHYSNYATGNSIAISPSGLALTAQHCTIDRSTTEENQVVEVVTVHKTRDVAVVQLPRHRRYSYLKLGDSDALKPGEEILLCGYGYKSFLCNSGFIQGRDSDYVYTSALMVHGQSGGAVLNTAGEVVGINKGHFPCNQEKRDKDPFHAETAFFVPINQAKELLLECCDETESGWKVRPSAAIRPPSN